MPGDEMISQTTSWVDPATGFEYLMITTGDEPGLVKLVSVAAAETVKIPLVALEAILVLMAAADYEADLKRVIVTEAGLKKIIGYPHYFSTYCQHGDHEDCRLTCKTCSAPCLCSCHAEL